ncbi:response regulator [Mesorhizobium sp. ES1-1]|uniref:response regulator n=1 Tax=Mesorhizobium sp. ES1-1 TaxID=2876629 RepID=UPI001CCB2D41|nr:response regulator [Mesorhizobium sp. ES1-1]MBZ9677584.1 response regulator [Mesorhizobium sp. ES1-1]
MQRLVEAKILIVEDEFLVADDIARYFAGLGAHILGPVATVAEAQMLAEEADAAVLDIDLNGASVFPVADRLSELGIPFVFFSAYDRNVIPSRLDHIASLMKPTDRRKIIAALFPDTDVKESIDDPLDVLALLPKLRLAGRLMLPDAGAADRLVEMTLELAIRESADRPAGMSTERWLNSILKRVANSSAGLLH